MTAPTVTLLSALICLPAAYAFARFQFPGRRFLLLSFLSANSFPKIGLYISIATLFYRLHLMTTFWGVVLIQLMGTLLFMIWIPTGTFRGINRSLEEAARRSEERRVGKECRSRGSPCQEKKNVEQGGRKEWQ